MNAETAAERDIAHSNVGRRRRKRSRIRRKRRREGHSKGTDAMTSWTEANNSASTATCCKSVRISRMTDPTA